MIYLIDGDNLLHVVGFQHYPTVEAARHRLLQWLDDSLVRKNPDLSLQVVFDSPNSSQAIPETHFRNILVRHSFRETADDLIESILKGTALAEQIVVVSNDRRLQEAARLRRQRSMTCESLIDLSLASSIKSGISDTPIPLPEKPEQELSESELEEWSQIFKEPRKPR